MRVGGQTKRGEIPWSSRLGVEALAQHFNTRKHVFWFGSSMKTTPEIEKDH
jgi:hypothetical protein